MIDGTNVTAIIVGRGGSKGLPGKNLAPLRGRPMVAWSVAAALESHFIDIIAVSSDDPEILKAAAAAGCERMIERPRELGTDDASIHDVLAHALDVLGRPEGMVVLLQTTSPLRTGADIDACIRACMDANAPAAVTVSPVSKPPQWMFRMRTNGSLAPLTEDLVPARRQDVDPVYALNGAVYVAETEWYRRNRRFLDNDTVGVEMPPERSVDVDTEFDLAIARTLFQQTEEKKSCPTS